MALETAFETLRNDDLALDILFLIGILPEGLFFEDLSRMTEREI